MIVKLMKELKRRMNVQSEKIGFFFFYFFNFFSFYNFYELREWSQMEFLEHYLKIDF